MKLVRHLYDSDANKGDVLVYRRSPLTARREHVLPEGCHLVLSLLREGPGFTFHRDVEWYTVGDDVSNFPAWAKLAVVLLPAFLAEEPAGLP